MGQTHPVIAVFDMNIYLNVARFVGEPYSRSLLHTTLMGQIHQPSPRSTPLTESAKLVAISSSGVFAGNQLLQVWTSDWIVKGTQRVAGRDVNLNGLGWSLPSAQGLVSDLIFGTVVTPSNGLQLPTNKRAKFPGLSPDDSQVLNTALQTKIANPASEVICVTNDVGFRNTTSNQDVVMMNSNEFLTFITDARKALSS